MHWRHMHLIKAMHSMIAFMIYFRRLSLQRATYQYNEHSKYVTDICSLNMKVIDNFFPIFSIMLIS